MIGLLLFVVGFLAVIVAMQEAFAIVASDDPTSKARLLADAIMKAERIKALTRFTSPLGLILFVGGIGALIALRLHGPPSAGPLESARDTEGQIGDDDEDQDEQDDEGTHQDAKALADESTKRS